MPRGAATSGLSLNIRPAEAARCGRSRAASIPGGGSRLGDVADCGHVHPRTPMPLRQANVQHVGSIPLGISRPGQRCCDPRFMLCAEMSSKSCEYGFTHVTFAVCIDCSRALNDSIQEFAAM